MSGEWFECVCQFFRAQSANLTNVLQSLGNQNTISDIGSSDTLQLPQSDLNISPMHLFMLFLAMMWAWMFIFSKNKQVTEKPANKKADDDPSGSSGDSSQGSGGTGLTQ